MSWWVMRSQPLDPERPGDSWTGPFRSFRQALREVNAWLDAGWAAAVVQSSADVRARVRAWEKAKKQRQEQDR